MTVCAPTVSLLKKVNSKVYSRRLGAQLGLAQIEGFEAETVEEFSAKIAAFAPAIFAAGRELLIKDGLGVSGKGIVAAPSLAKAMRYVTMLQRQAMSKGTTRCSLVCEAKVAIAAEYNYQFLVTRAGLVEYHFAKRSLVHKGVHQGHLLGAGVVTDEIDQCFRQSAALIGKAMAADGFYGIVGVDSLVDEAGNIYPNLEINARFNMSTFQSVIHEKLVGPERVAWAGKFDLKIARKVSFKELAERLQGHLYDRNRRKGLIITNFAAVNAALEIGKASDGRLYSMIIEKDLNHVYETKQLIEALLTEYA